jgi:hypothetical protein
MQLSAFPIRPGWSRLSAARQCSGHLEALDYIARLRRVAAVAPLRRNLAAWWRARSALARGATLGLPRTIAPHVDAAEIFAQRLGAFRGQITLTE